MTRTLLTAALAVPLFVAPLVAQAADPTVADLHLGGDSTQATTVALRAHEVYRLEITPARALILVRLRSRFPERPLEARPVTDRTPPAGGAVFAIAPPRTGDYIVELTNTGVGSTHVRIVRELPAGSRLATGDSTRAAPSPLAASDSEATVLDETYPALPSIVLLMGEIAYRVETQPREAAAAVEIRTRAGNVPILALPTGTAGGPGFVVIPTSTDEYRVTVATIEPVRVRIIRDPKATARWVRIAEATRDLPRAGISVRAVAIGAFPRPVTGSDSTASGVGIDMCFGSVARGGWTTGPIAGCVFSLAIYKRNHQADVVAISIVPRLVLTPPRMTTQFSLGVSVGIGTTVQSSQSQSYFMLGLSGVVERPMSRHWVLEAEAGFTAVNASQNAYPSSNPAIAYAPRAALGLQYRP